MGRALIIVLISASAWGEETDGGAMRPGVARSAFTNTLSEPDGGAAAAATSPGELATALAEDGGVETLVVTAAASAGAMISARSNFVTEAEPTEELEIFPLLHGDVEIAREAGPFRVTGRAALLATTMSVTTIVPVMMTTSVPVVRDLGSFIEGSARLHGDTRLAVRLMPFAPQSIFRVPFDFANFSNWPVRDLRTELVFAPAVFTTISGEKWHASLGGAFSVVIGRPFMPSPPTATLPRFITEFGIEHDGLRVDLRAGVVALDNDFLEVDIPNPGRLSASARVNWRTGDVGRPIDLVTYRDDPDRFSTQFAPLPRPGFAFESELELGASDQLAGIGEDTWGSPMYAQLRLAAKLDLQRIFGTLRVRTPAQIGLGAIRDTTAPVEERSPALIGHLGFDRRIGPVLVGLSTRVSLPARVAWSLGGSNPPPGLPSDRIALWISGTDGTSHRALFDSTPTVRVALKATVRVDLGAHVTLLAELDFDRRTFPEQFLPRTTFAFQTITAHVFAQLR